MDIKEINKQYLDYEFESLKLDVDIWSKHIQKTNSNLEYFNSSLMAHTKWMFQKIINLKAVNSNDSFKYSFLLIKQIIKSNVNIRRFLILNEYYDSQALLRKQFESVTRLHELNKKKVEKLEKKTPNISNTFSLNTTDIKSELSEYIHASTLNSLDKTLSIDYDFSNNFIEDVNNEFYRKWSLSNSLFNSGTLNFYYRFYPDDKEIIKGLAKVLFIGNKYGILNYKEMNL